MKNDEKRFCVVLSESNLSSKAEHGYITGTDIVSDVCYALGLWTWEDVESNNAGYLNESVDRFIEDYDWKTYTRDLLNADKLENEAEAIKASDYLAGDWYEINQPETFAKLVDRERAKACDELTDCYPFNPDAANAPQDLKNDLQRGIDWTYDHMREEWLHGDRSSYGALGEISKHFTGSHHDCEYDQKEDTLTLTFTEESARDFMGYDIEEGEEVTQERLQEAVTAHLLQKVADRRREQERKRGERIEAQERNRKAEEERQEGLREEARERKRKAGV